MNRMTYTFLLAGILILRSQDSVAYPDEFFVDSNVDRAGMNYRDFDLSEARPELCQKECDSDAECKAYTYVKPGTQGPQARCWLKSDVPNAVASECCISGLKGSLTIELGVNRPGMDLKNLELAEARSELCRAACIDERGCEAYTYIKPGVQGPQAHCWLKSDVPNAVADSCCISGVRASEQWPALVVTAAPSGPDEETKSHDFVDIPGLTSSIATAAGSNLAITIIGEVETAANARMFVRTLVDNVPVAPDDVVFAVDGFTGTRSFTFVKNGLGRGVHAVRAQWHVDEAGTALIGNRTLTLQSSQQTNAGGNLVVNARPSGPDIDTTSSSFENIPGLSSGITTAAQGNLAITVSGEVKTSANKRMFIRALVDGRPANPRRGVRLGNFWRNALVHVYCAAPHRRPAQHTNPVAS